MNTACHNESSESIPSASLNVPVCIGSLEQATAMLKYPLARGLALCDAAKLSLPILDVTLTSGFFTVSQKAAKVGCGAADSPSSAPAAHHDISAPSRARLGVPTSAASPTQSRCFSSEDGFRSYGRDFGSGEAPSGGAAANEEPFADTSMPEGMEDAGDEEQQESQDEMEMRLRLLESALKHVVCSAAPSSPYMSPFSGS